MPNSGQRLRTSQTSWFGTLNYHLMSTQVRNTRRVLQLLLEQRDNRSLKLKQLALPSETEKRKRGRAHPKRALLVPSHHNGDTSGPRQKNNFDLIHVERSYAHQNRIRRYCT